MDSLKSCSMSLFWCEAQCVRRSNNMGHAVCAHPVKYVVVQSCTRAWSLSICRNWQFSHPLFTNCMPGFRLYRMGVLMRAGGGGGGRVNTSLRRTTAVYWWWW